MALTYTSAIAALLHDGKDKQVLPISMANLIELAKDKSNFGKDAQSVQDALSYLAGSFAHANTAAQTAQNNAYEYVSQEIGNLDVAKVGSSDKDGHEKYISYIWEKDGKIEAFAQDMTATNVAYTGGDSRTTVAAELEHINSTIASNLTATTLQLVKTGSKGTDEVAEKVSADGTEYRLKQGDTVVAKFNIEKDSFVKSGAVVRGTLDGNNFKEGTPDAPGKYYIKLEIKTHDAATDSAAEHTLYIPAESLVDAYSAKNDGNNVTITIDQDNNTISAKINAGGVGENELATDAVTTAKIKDANVTTEKIADGNVTLEKLAQGVKDSLGKADSALQQTDITTGTKAGAISVKNTSVDVYGLKAVATSGKAEDVTVATIANLDSIAGYTGDTHVNNVQDALATLAGKVKAINDGAVTSVKASVTASGKDTQNAVNISMTPVNESKGAVEVILKHNLGSAAALDYDATTSATPVSSEFWESVK